MRGEAAGTDLSCCRMQWGSLEEEDEDQRHTEPPFNEEIGLRLQSPLVELEWS